MRIINKLAPPGEIKSVRLTPEMVIVWLGEETLVYRRIKDAGMQDFSVRCSTLPSELRR